MFDKTSSVGMTNKRQLDGAGGLSSYRISDYFSKYSYDDCHTEDEVSQRSHPHVKTRRWNLHNIPTGLKPAGGVNITYRI